MDKPDRILLFIPMYNCVRQIPRVLAQITDDLQEWLTEIVVIDNGSTDGSREAAGEAIKRLRVKASVLLNRENYSLGGSHKVAFNYAKQNGFDYVIVFHGDDQGSIADIRDRLEAGAHRAGACLLGSRFMPGSKLIGYARLRIVLNHIVNLAFSVVTFRRVLDIGSGLNMYKVDSLRGDFYLSFPNTLLFNVYMLLYYIRTKRSIVFFPISWREEDQISNARLVPMGLAMIRIFLRYVLAPGKLLEPAGGVEKEMAYVATPVHSNRQT